MKQSHYNKLKIIDQDIMNLWSYCPYHNDTVRPNLSISIVDEYYGVYKCWACGKHGKLTDAQMKRLKYLKPQTYKNQHKKSSIYWNKFVKDCKANLDKLPLLKLILAKQLDVRTKSISDWDIGYDGYSYIIPMRRDDIGMYRKNNGICGAQRRYFDGSKRCLVGSHLGYMYCSDYYVYRSGYYDGEYDDTIFIDNTIFICEGFSDAISVYDLGFNVMARPHCYYYNGIIGLIRRLNLKNWQFVIIPDNDEVGKEGARALNTKLHWHDTDSYIMSFGGAKDIRELITQKGKETVKKMLLAYI